MPRPFCSSAVPNLTFPLMARPTGLAPVVVEDLVLRADADVPEPGFPTRVDEGSLVPEARLEEVVGLRPMLHPDVAEELELVRRAVADVQPVLGEVDSLGIAVVVVAGEAQRERLPRQRVRGRKPEEPGVSVDGGSGRSHAPLLAVDRHRPGLDFLLLHCFGGSLFLRRPGCRSLGQSRTGQGQEGQRPRGRDSSLHDRPPKSGPSERQARRLYTRGECNRNATLVPCKACAVPYASARRRSRPGLNS